ncbi:TRAP transporter large permease subunit [Phyllobacterium salinisoli]|uniref:TRAP transporter large permease subunit n=1 Tax=Phyllobacterium salinisoli TaxID=1899321 RepID=UPI00135C97C7|nr:TRAP transporter large permease subunit [Phyllobacterium salinisoli]
MTTPLLLPVATQLGIVRSVNLTIAGFTPPVGTMMFITIAIAKVRMEDYVKECWSFLIALAAALLLITFCPGQVMFLPNAFM